MNDDHAASCTDLASIPPTNPLMFKSSTAMKPRLTPSGNARLAMLSSCACLAKDTRWINITDSPATANWHAI